ncbi:PA3496 family putative envelope integrity protein [Agarivorans sp. 1_MG-2023]|uniref:PA3496 family putative envelope integrity protein n=1 Tax=Agarivorans sp. 1_MG-2023 TaxID=3062634 RepID=UPI0026E3F476|nr:hypothetical protein [Agarivorans sp. 1_MG-2023]MDO6762437.1 hypothetical protein [Agarivorans sp. 1_MG-2023]
MKFSRFDDIDEWEDEDKAHHVKQHKKVKNGARTRRRIDEYNERKQLGNCLSELASFS